MSLTWRFGAPAVLLLLAAVALGLWRSGTRFGPRVAVTQTARRSLAEQIRGTGQFALRFGGGEALHAATLRALRDAAIRRVPSYDAMLKALFFIQHRGTIEDIEITRAEEPELFEFIDRLADEAHAPRAHKVYLSPHVNASVFYDLSLLNLVIPSKKNLMRPGLKAIFTL